MKMLENRDGSIGEDIAAIDSRSGKVLLSIKIQMQKER